MELYERYQVYIVRLIFARSQGSQITTGNDWNNRGPAPYDVAVVCTVPPYYPSAYIHPPRPIGNTTVPLTAHFENLHCRLLGVIALILLTGIDENHYRY